MKKIVILAVILTFLGLSPGAFAGDVAAGKVKAAEKRCFICHGKDGISMGNPLWPNLKGQKPGIWLNSLRLIEAASARMRP